MNFLVPKFGIYEYLRNRPNKSVIHQSRGYSLTILNHLQGEQEIVMIISVKSRKHLEATSTKVEVYTDNTVG